MRTRSLLLLGLTTLLGVASLAGTAEAKPTLADYRYFRALSVDLAGRIPTRADLVAFETAGFDIDAWIDKRLAETPYANRVRRTYMDLLRLDIGQTFTFRPSATVLRRQAILDSDGKTTIYVYYRNGQRRTREETDGSFCLSKADIGVTYTGIGAIVAGGTLHAVDATVLAKNTKLVKPWWLYRDYKSPAPKELYGTPAWTGTDPTYAPVTELLKEADGSSTTMVRVCNEEATATDTGTVYWTGRKAPPAGSVPPYERLNQLPLDDSYAITNKGKVISCSGGTAFAHTTDCGCGPGLEGCMPAAGNSTEPIGFNVPGATPLGVERPMDIQRTTQSSWLRFWWGREAETFLTYVAANDRDFREVLTAKYTLVNGPLTQFYKSSAPATCCDYNEPQALTDPAKLPTDLLPHDTKTWKLVADRGPAAAGIMTMPIFLTKYGTRRGRAHVLYNAFQCKDFVAESLQLKPSTEPDLTKRDGCSTCHVTLEPMSAYFARVLESDWTWLPPTQFPLDASKCRSADPLKMPGYCKSYYDPAFTSASQSLLRGSYSSAAHADAGPAGLGKQLVESDDFAKCVTRNMAQSFIGRQLGPDDDATLGSLTKAFTDGGYKMKALVRALVHAGPYKTANNLSSDAWRAEGGAK